MNSQLEKRLTALANGGAADISGGAKGVEKESLRIKPSGRLSARPHPDKLGSALTNRFITTDFSEALLEFVTPAYTNTWETLRAICDIHQFTYANLDDELLWVASMPCRLPADADIPLARYGSSNVGRMKTIYRRGLGFRYGRQMQTIAGVHFNYSLPETFWPAYRAAVGGSPDLKTFRSDQYMALVRNFRRLGWLLLYLFGASPALCKSFSGERQQRMPSLNDDTWYEPFGTSLRMSDLGYNNQTQARLSIDLNSVEAYIRDLSAAVRTPERRYEKFGVKHGGRYRQLNANILQIENEYYSPIRPKRVAKSGEPPTAALRRGGVEYVEVRALDINLFDPCGINQNTMRFLEAFLVYCLLESSPPLDESGMAEAASNQLQTAVRGRDPALMLQHDSKAKFLSDWARQLLHDVSDVAEVIDSGGDGNLYRDAVKAMLKLVDDPEATPSARMLADMQSTGGSFFEYALSVAESHREYFATIAPLSDDRRRAFEHEAEQSLERQIAIEKADDISLDEYLARYFAQL